MAWLEEVVRGREAKRERMIQAAGDLKPKILADTKAACAVDRRLPASLSPSLGNLAWSSINSDSALNGTSGAFCSLFRGDRQEDHQGNTTLTQTGNISETIQGNLDHGRLGNETISLTGNRDFNHVGNLMVNRTESETTTNYGPVTRTFIAPYTEAHAASRQLMQPTTKYDWTAISMRMVGFIQNNVGVRVRLMGSDNRATLTKIDVVGLKGEAGMANMENKLFKLSWKGIGVEGSALNAKMNVVDAKMKAIEAGIGLLFNAPPCVLLN